MMHDMHSNPRTVVNRRINLASELYNVILNGYNLKQNIKIKLIQLNHIFWFGIVILSQCCQNFRENLGNFRPQKCSSANFFKKYTLIRLYKNVQKLPWLPP